jgi:hypothetical protein
VQLFPGCKLSYMTTPESRHVNSYGRSDIFGAGRPNDNYAKWRAGCESARSAYRSG